MNQSLSKLYKTNTGQRLLNYDRSKMWQGQTCFLSLEPFPIPLSNVG